MSLKILWTVSAFGHLHKNKLTKWLNYYTAKADTQLIILSTNGQLHVYLCIYLIYYGTEWLTYSSCTM